MKCKKSIIIVVMMLMAVVASIVVINCVGSKRKAELEKRLDSESSLESYASGKSALFGELLEEGELTFDDINGITLGVNTGDGLTRVFIDDEKLISEMCDKLSEVEVHGVSGSLNKYVEEWKWHIILYSDKEYSIVVYGYSTTEDNIESTMINVAYKESYSSIYEQEVNGEFVEKNVVGIIDSYHEQMLIDENINAYVNEMYKEYVKDITKEQLISLHKSEEIKLEDIFRYNHSQTGNGNIKDYTFIDGSVGELGTNIYKFSIEGSACYIEVESGATSINENEKRIFGYDIVRIDLFNENSDKLNFYDVTTAELEQFLE